MFKIPEAKKGEEENPKEGIDDDIDVDKIVKIISPEKTEAEDGLGHAMMAGTTWGKKDPVKTTGSPTAEKSKAAKSEEESIERLVGKIDEVYQNLDELSRGIVQVNMDLKARISSLTTDMDKLSKSLGDAAQAVEQARSGIPSVVSSPQAGQGREATYAAPQGQQPPPQQTYQPSAYGYRSTPPPQQPPQQSYYQQPPPQQQPQQGYYQQPPPQQGFYSQPPPQQGFFQQQQAPPPPPGASPEEAAAKGAESLRGTVFDDVVSAMNQVASIVFSRLLDAREKILRIDPSFPVQEFEPVLSELRANPRMKLSQVDKRKLIDRMLFWASRLPRLP